MAIVPLGGFVRFVIMGGAAVWSNWDTISGLFERAVESPSTPIFGHYSTHVFEMKDGSGAWTARERGQFGIHWVNVTGGDLDASWTSADFAAVESAVQTMWTALASKIPNDIRLVEHRWYAYGPGVLPPNPPSRVTAVSPMSGSFASSSVPHQVASTVTLRTSLRRHWGRFYLPVGGAVDFTGGTIGSTTVDSLAAAARTMLTAPGASQGIFPVVYDRNRHAALGVTEIEVDSTPDIIRRRRIRTTTYRKVHSS